jgi:hypothetical protein
MAVRTGDWEWAVRHLAEVMANDLDPADRLVALEQRTIIVLLRGEDATDLLAEAEAIAGDNDELVSFLDERLAVRAWMAGERADAIVRWRRYAAYSPLNATMALAKAVRVSLWDGDLAAARTDLEAHVATANHGGGIDAARATMRAGIAALSGDRPAALRGYRDALRQWRDLGLAWDEALCGLDIALLLGADEADVRAAAERSREVFASVGARPFLERLEAALGSEAVTGGDAPSTTARVSSPA